MSLTEGLNDLTYSHLCWLRDGLMTEIDVRHHHNENSDDVAKHLNRVLDEIRCRGGDVSNDYCCHQCYQISTGEFK